MSGAVPSFGLFRQLDVSHMSILILVCSNKMDTEGRRNVFILLSGVSYWCHCDLNNGA